MLFGMFCFHCKREKPKLSMKQNGTMVTVIQKCTACGPSNQYHWRSQPLILGRYPAGNILMSFGIIMSGISINQVMLMFKHIGLCITSVRTYFLHQRKFLFPAVLKHWEQYRSALIDKLKGIKETHWCGDGRFDSMGHNAKYGCYSMFCNTISKIVHFELLQVLCI